jgi:hypothetical protein
MVMKEREILVRNIIVLTLLILIPAVLMDIYQTTEMGVISTPKPNLFSATPLFAIDGWYLYIDREVGYSFSYPSDAYLQFGKSKFHPYHAVTILFRIPNSYGNLGMVIDVQKNIRRLSPEEFARTLWPANVEIPENFLSKAETIDIVGIAALKVEIPPTLADFVIIFPYQDKMFIVFPADDPMNIDDPAKAEHLSLFNKVLGSFRFEANGGLP